MTTKFARAPESRLVCSCLRKKSLRNAGLTESTKVTAK